jgi:hypothetical protein
VVELVRAVGPREDVASTVRLGGLGGALVWALAEAAGHCLSFEALFARIYAERGVQNAGMEKSLRQLKEDTEKKLKALRDDKWFLAKDRTFELVVKGRDVVERAGGLSSRRGP